MDSDILRHRPLKLLALYIEDICICDTACKQLRRHYLEERNFKTTKAGF
jgi:hypothetical protein